MDKKIALSIVILIFIIIFEQINKFHMKKIFFILLLLTTVSCNKETSNSSANPANGGSCGSYNNKPTYKGEQGGCYYINSNGNKTYVDHQYCPC